DFDLFRTNLAARATTMRSARRLVDEMLNVRIPVVAAVNGPAVGLGATLSSLCDVVFIADTAHLADPHVAVALVAGDGGALTSPPSATGSPPRRTRTTPRSTRPCPSSSGPAVVAEVELAPEDAAFRDELRDWLADNLVGEFLDASGIGGPADDRCWDLRLEWERKLAAGRWLNVSWPVEYGGRGGTPTQELIFQIEHAKAEAPYWVGVQGRDLFGPTLLEFG